MADYSGWGWIYDYCGGSHTSQALLFATIVNHAKPGENLTREETLWEEYISSMDVFGIPLCNYLCYFCDYNPDQRRCHILLIWVKWKMIDSRGSIYQNFATLFFLVSTVICWSYCCSSASQWRWSKAFEHPEPRSKMMFPTNIVRFPGTFQEFWGRGRIF